MKTSEFDKLAREQFLPLLPGFEGAKGLLFEKPIGDLLRGFTFQGSSYDRTSFHLVAFVQPLYIPADEEMPTFSERSPRLASTNALDDIRSFIDGPGRKFLEGLRTPGDFADWLEREEAGHKPDPFALEALAYSGLLADRVDDAERWLEAAATSADAYMRDDVDEGLYAKDEEHPLQAVLQRTAQVRDALDSGAEEAIALLERWREETARNLGLSKHLAPPEHEPAR
jgi:hypothetical protein